MDILLVLVTLFVLFAWSRAMLRFRDRVITLKEFLFWSAIWGGAIVLAVFRTRLNFLSDASGIRRPVDVLLYASIILLFYLMFRLYVKIEGVHQELTKVVREQAIKRRK